MTVPINEQIKLAEQIANDLPEVTRSEWNKWVQIAEQYGIDQAIQYAQQMSEDVTLRPAIKRANRLLSQKMKRYQSSLISLDVAVQKAIWGYIANLLTVNTLRGSSRP